MADEPTVHHFDRSRAKRYEPKAATAKTAVLVDILDPEAITVIKTSFGEQRLRGPFYIVVDGDDSYGAAEAEFTRAHRTVGSNQWVKVEGVLGYQLDERAVVETVVGDVQETKVTAEPGDWIVEQVTGEVMILQPDAFQQRYIPAAGSN